MIISKVRLPVATVVLGEQTL